MRYSINGISSVFDLMAYTIAAMKEVGYGECDIDDYIDESVKTNNLAIIELSKEKLDDCNTVANQVSPNNNEWFEDTWRDHYYSSLWDDDGRYDHKFEDEDDELDTYDYLTGKKKHHIWDDDNVVDDVESADEKEAYEGFSSCKNHYWDSSEDDDLDNPFAIHDYYDEMKHEFDPSYDLCYDPWADNNDKEEI